MCEVVDAKVAYGQLRVKVEPVTGEGRQWLDWNAVRPLVEMELEALMDDLAEEATEEAVETAEIEEEELRSLAEELEDEHEHEDDDDRW